MGTRYSTRVAKGAAALKTIGYIKAPGTTFRPKVVGFQFGNIDAVVVDAGYEVQIIRGTASGSVVVAQTPRPHNFADPVAGTVVEDTYSGTEPTTAGQILFAEGLNKRNSLIWYAPPGDGFIIPAVANSGVALWALTGGAGNASDWAGTFVHEE